MKRTLQMIIPGTLLQDHFFRTIPALHSEKRKLRMDKVHFQWYIRLERMLFDYKGENKHRAISLMNSWIFVCSEQFRSYSDCQSKSDYLCFRLESDLSLKTQRRCVDQQHIVIFCLTCIRNNTTLFVQRNWSD